MHSFIQHHSEVTDIATLTLSPGIYQIVWLTARPDQKATSVSILTIWRGRGEYLHQGLLFSPEPEGSLANQMGFSGISVVPSVLAERLQGPGTSQGAPPL